MKRNQTILTTLFLGTLIGITSSIFIKQNSVETHAYYTPSVTYKNGDAATYYESIDESETGDSLLSSLRTLNLSRRKTTIAYKTMGTSTSTSPYVYTDYDPNGTVYTDSNGQKYGTSVLSFYSGISTTTFNKEHVWPNSRGGGDGGNAGSPYVDADIHMPRPTITSENSNRGNSVYVEGQKSSTTGWDPVTAFKDTIGTYNNIRGECARIVFYCMTVNSNLVLVDDNDIGNSTKTKMGKLSDLLKWNLNYAVNDRENIRNEGAEYLQGNRNAFVDHPEYACKIWGNYNSETKKICGSIKSLESISLNQTSKYLFKDETLQLSVTANYDDETTGDVTALATYTSDNESVATVDENGLITCHSSLRSQSATITVSYLGKEATCVIYGDGEDEVYLDKTLLEMYVGDNEQITATGSGEVTWSVDDTTIASVDNSGNVEAKKEGSTIVRATVGKAVATCNVNVSNHSISLDKSSISIDVGSTSKLTATATGAVTFSSSNTSIATVDDDGVIKGIAVGDCQITATCGNAEATCAVNVKSPSLINDGLSFDTAFTPSEAISHIDANDLDAYTNYYVKGLYKSTSYAWKNNKMTILVSDEEDSSTTFQFYKMTSSSDPGFNVGDSVTAYASGAKLIKYYSTYEMNVCTFYEKHTFVNADTYSANFIDAINCDVTGKTSPVYNSSWEELESSYLLLSSTQKSHLVDATYSLTGAGSKTVVTPLDSTSQIVANAMSKYDLIVAKYGKKAFIARENMANLKQNTAFGENSKIDAITILVSTIISLTSVVGMLMLTKSKKVKD